MARHPDRRPGLGTVAARAGRRRSSRRLGLAAEARGVDPERLRCALPSRCRATSTRFRLADLFLDTVPFGSAHDRQRRAVLRASGARMRRSVVRIARVREPGDRRRAPRPRRGLPRRVRRARDHAGQRPSATRCDRCHAPRDARPACRCSISTATRAHSRTRSSARGARRRRTDTRLQNPSSAAANAVDGA